MLEKRLSTIVGGLTVENYFCSELKFNSRLDVEVQMELFADKLKFLSLALELAIIKRSRILS